MDIVIRYSFDVPSNLSSVVCLGAGASNPPKMNTRSGFYVIYNEKTKSVYAGITTKDINERFKSRFEALFVLGFEPNDLAHIKVYPVSVDIVELNNVFVSISGGQYQYNSSTINCDLEHILIYSVSYPNNIINTKYCVNTMKKYKPLIKRYPPVINVFSQIIFQGNVIDQIPL